MSVILSRIHIPLVLAAVLVLAVQVGSSRADYVATILADNPTAYYRFEEPAGTTVTVDSSPNGHDSVGMFNALFGSLAPVGHAVEFNNDGSIVVDLQLNPETQDFSIEMITNVSIPVGSANFVAQMDGQGVGRSLLIETAGTPEFGSYIGGATSTSGFLPRTNTWYHVVMTYDAEGGDDAIRFYVDGAAEGTGSQTAEFADGDWVIGSHKSQTSGFLDGFIDELSIYDYRLDDPNGDNSMTDSRVPAHAAEVPPPPLLLTVDRGTGSIVLTANDVSGVLGYSITSAGGALDPENWTTIADNYDASGDGSVDPTENWVVLTNTTAPTHADLSEFAPLGPGGTLADGSPIDLGSGNGITTLGPWIRSPNEDLAMELLLDDGSRADVSVSFVGNEGTPFETGDLNFDGTISTADWPIYRSGMFADLSAMTGAQAYQMGDLDGDGKNNETDFVLFKTAFDGANGAGAFDAMLTAVPEPSSLLLLALGGLALLRRRGLMVLALVVTLVAASSAGAATLTWTGGGAQPFDFADLANWSGTPTGGTIDTVNLVDDYVVPAPTDFDVTRAARLNFREGGGLVFEDGMLATGTAGLGILEDPDSFGFINQSGGSISTQFLAEMTVTLSGTANLTLNGGGNPVNVSTVNMTSPDVLVHFNSEDIAAFTSEHLGKFSVNGEPAVLGANLNVVSDGATGSFVTIIPPPEPLTLEINTTTGAATLLNETAAAIELDFYKLTSDSGSLDPAGWESLEDQNLPGFPAGDGSGNGWEAGGGSNAGELGEAYLQGSSVVAVGQSISLGRAFAAPGGQEDIGFRYRDRSNDPVLFIDGDVHYIAGALLGDVNLDTVVNGLDVDPFVDVLLNGPFQAEADMNSDGVVNGLDVDPFVAAVVGGGVQAVPEPSTLVLLSLAALLGLSGARRRQVK